MTSVGPDGFTRLAENLANDAALIRLAQAEALRTAARTFVTEIGDAWGGDSRWVTTGTRVAEVVACVLREMASDLDELSAPPASAEVDRVRAAVAEALESLDAMCADEDRHGSNIRAHEVRGAVADLRRLVTPPGSRAGGDADA